MSDRRGFEIAVAVILDDSEHLVLLHRQDSLYDHWEFPGGKPRQGELPAATALRELEEELGVVGNCIGPSLRIEFTDRGTSNVCILQRIAGLSSAPRVMEPNIFSELRAWPVATLRDEPLAKSPTLGAVIESLGVDGFAEWVAGR
jgi:8-oxo-dGTP pyrophosphatase MutT (NUDIX family)